VVYFGNGLASLTMMLLTMANDYDEKVIDDNDAVE
jgi:hypothetical protein